MISRKRTWSFGPPLLFALLAGCGATRPSTLGLREGRLAPCPASPNCVASDAADATHAIAPFAPTISAGDAWRIAHNAVASLSRTTIINDTGSYLHAECTSPILGFVDDLELALDGSGNIIAVRSASRVGYSDLGVNRTRVETLRRTLADQGLFSR